MAVLNNHSRHVVASCIIACASSAAAMPLSRPQNVTLIDSHQRSVLVKPVAVYGVDGRMLLSEGGPKLHLTNSEMDRIRNTTGFVRCDSADPKNSAIASAAIVGDGSHIITTAHSFRNEKTMEWRLPLSSCYFQNQAQHPTRIPLDISENDRSKLMVGSKFPANEGDFAVAKLKTRIPGIKPFPVDLAMRPIQQNGLTIVISAVMKDFRKNDLKHPIVQECPIRDILLDQTTILLSTCATDHGASGSVHLRRSESGQLVIKGIIVGGDDDHKRTTYSYLDGQHTYSVGLDGEFLGDLLALDPSIKPGQGAE